MNIYDIRFCKKSELGLLQSFIDKHWRKGHVLARSKELFEFQHLYDGFDDYTFAIALNNISKEIDGVLGLINYWKYDPSHTIPNVGWSAIWKVREDVDNPEIGGIAFKLLKFILVKGGISAFCSLGISKTYKDIAIKLHFTVAEMNHYYIVNNEVHNYIVIINPEIKLAYKQNSYVINTLPTLDGTIVIGNNINRYKNLEYFRNRYEKHPFFNYIFWGVYQGEHLHAIIVVRIINVEGVNIIRIIDIMGFLSEKLSLYAAIQEMLHAYNAEYIDCLNAGISPSLFESLGFVKVNHKRGTIVPDHLCPLEHRYVPMEYAYISDEELVIFKGDGDQDRPNCLPDNKIS